MSTVKNKNKKPKTSHDSDSEPLDIEQKVDFELDKAHYNIIKLGAVTNTLAGLFVLGMLYKQVPITLLITWYAVLIISNVFNILWANYYQYKATPDNLRKWRFVMHFIVAFICLTWGSIGVLFHSANMVYQFYIVTFLQVVVLAFAFSTVIDFVTTAMSLTCLVIPTAIYRMYLAIHAKMIGTNGVMINIAFGVSLFILGAFLLAAAFIGYRLLRKSIKLSFENIALNIKLEHANRFLEERVKERTRELEESLQLVTYQATHDLLTNLPNQRLLLEYMQKIMDLSINNNHHQFAVACFTINETEKINDGLGHQIGDAIIKVIAQRFQHLFSKPLPHDPMLKYIVTLSRKDVFVILIDPVDPYEVEKKAEIIFKVVEDHVYIEDHSIKLTGSIGVSLYPRDGNNANAVLMNADAAMLHAKKHGGNNIYTYQSEINASINKQIELESNLHAALNNKEFFLHYQPLIDLKTKVIMGAEALIRWKSPIFGTVPPDDFIPLAESNGLIIPLGEWLLNAACQELKKWHQQGHTYMKMAINVSAKQLLQKNVIQSIMNIIKENNLSPESIELELTEREAFQASILPVLKSINDHGLGLSIDDFGTGYSGLSYLKLFPISKIKIDKSFIKDIDTNHDSQVIVSNTINLAKKINVTVLVEGVETQEQVDFLSSHDCDMVQGYYFSRPVESAAFIELLKNNNISM
jgi:diguanylate cyclase (GGDEF)-like protein